MPEVDPIQCPDCRSTWLISSEQAICIELFGGCLVCKAKTLKKGDVGKILKLKQERFPMLVKGNDQSHLIDKIEEVRAGNNFNWMDIMRLALKVAPEETKEIIKRIVKADKEIKNLLEELVK
jgi:hypothetical protein